MRAVVITRHGGPEVLRVEERPDPASELSPVVAQAFPFERAGEAHTFIQERRNVGKVVLTP